MQVFDDRIQAESGWNSFHPDSAWIETPDDGQRRCPKHVEFYNKINFSN